MKMKRVGSTFAVLLLAVCVADTINAMDVSFGHGFDGWTFTQTAEPNGVYNCRAHKKNRDQHYIIAYRTNEDNAGYFSMSAKGIGKGKYPSQMTFSSGIIDVDAETNGKRLWVPLGDPDLEKVAEEGGFVFHVGQLGAIEVDLGTRTADAYARVIQCVEASR